MDWLRQILGLKRLVHRGRAADLFLEHLRAESDRLKRNIIPALAMLCESKKRRLTLDAILARPWVTYERGAFRVASKTLLDAHCFAIASVCGLEAIHAHIDPRSQATPMLWTSHRLIAGQDVGKENVGYAPSPRPMPDMHVSYRAGSFAGGISSQQQTLVRRYEAVRAIPEQVVLLLLSLRVVEPKRGVGKAVYSEEKIGPGFFARNRIGTLEPAPVPIDEWEADIVVTDAVAALSGVPKQAVAHIQTTIEDIDAFWPSFCRQYRLIW